MQDMQGDLRDAKMVSKSEGDATEEQDEGGMEGVDKGDHPQREPPSRASEEELQAIAALATVRKAGARPQRAVEPLQIRPHEDRPRRALRTLWRQETPAGAIATLALARSR